MKKTKLTTSFLTLATVATPTFLVTSCSTKHDANEITITFIASEGGKLSGQTTINVNKGTKWSEINKPTPQADQGNAFSGWYINGEKITDEYVFSESAQITAVFDNESVVTLKSAFDYIANAMKPNSLSKFKMEINDQQNITETVDRNNCIYATASDTNIFYLLNTLYVIYDNEGRIKGFQQASSKNPFAGTEKFCNDAYATCYDNFKSFSFNEQLQQYEGKTGTSVAGWIIKLDSNNNLNFVQSVSTKYTFSEIGTASVVKPTLKDNYVMTKQTDGSFLSSSITAETGKFYSSYLSLSDYVEGALPYSLTFTFSSSQTPSQQTIKAYKISTDYKVVELPQSTANSATFVVDNSWSRDDTLYFVFSHLSSSSATGSFKVSNYGKLVPTVTIADDDTHHPSTPTFKITTETGSQTITLENKTSIRYVYEVYADTANVLVGNDLSQMVTLEPNSLTAITISWTQKIKTDVSITFATPKTFPITNTSTKITLPDVFYYQSKTKTATITGIVPIGTEINDISIDTPSGTSSITIDATKATIKLKDYDSYYEDGIDVCDFVALESITNDHPTHAEAGQIYYGVDTTWNYTVTPSNASHLKFKVTPRGASVCVNYFTVSCYGGLVHSKCITQSGKTTNFGKDGMGICPWAYGEIVVTQTKSDGTKIEKTMASYVFHYGES